MTREARETRGQRVRRLRLAKGWSGDKLAVYAEIARPTLDRLETDQPVREDNVRSVAHALGVSFEYLMTGIDPDREGGWASPEVALRATTTLSEGDIQTLVRLISALQKDTENRDTA